jgi:3',5'-cyclic AMP phosphodiesterase CpdA
MILHITLLLLLNASTAGQEKDSFTIIQITDPQFGFFENNKGFAKESELYRKAIDAINNIAPDFVVITGDLVNDMNDRAQIAEFKKITSLIGCPVWYSPGNHDIGLPPTEESMRAFVKDYGHDRFSLKHKKSLFIGLNSCLIKPGETQAEAEQFRWLEKELSKKGKKANNILVFVHYPFFITEPAEPEAYFNIAPAIREKYFRLFSKYGVDAVFAGHLHNNGYGRYDEIEMITTSASGKPLGKVPSGMRVINVKPDGIENSYRVIETDQ